VPFLSRFFAFCPTIEDPPAFMNEISSSSSVMGSLMIWSASVLDRAVVVKDPDLGFRAWFENRVRRSAVLPFSSPLVFVWVFAMGFMAFVPLLDLSPMSYYEPKCYLLEGMVQASLR